MAEIEFNFPTGPEPNPDNTTPPPTPGQIGWLKRSLEALGGAVAARLCRPRGLSYPSVSNIRSVMVNSAGCGHATLVHLPYQTADDEEATVTVCLACDGAAYWPRLESEEAVPPPTADRPPPFEA